MNDSNTGPNTLAFHLMVYEKFLLTDALRRSKGNCAKAAKELGTSKRVFSYKVRKHEIDYKQFRKKKTGETDPEQ